jgi:hypothetical protein
VTCNRVSVSRPRSTLALALPPSPYLLLCVPESTFLFLLSHLFFSTIMARSQSLLTPQPTNIVRQPVTICHVCVFFNLQTHCALSHIYIFYPRQLRDLIICPDERGVVNYVQDQCIMERDMTDPSSVSPFPFHLIFLSPPFFISFYFLLCLCVPMRATKKVRKGKEQTDSLGLKGKCTCGGIHLYFAIKLRHNSVSLVTQVQIFVPDADADIPHTSSAVLPTYAFPCPNQLQLLIDQTDTNLPSIPQLYSEYHRLPSHPRFR